MGVEEFEKGGSVCSLCLYMCVWCCVLIFLLWLLLYNPNNTFVTKQPGYILLFCPWYNKSTSHFFFWRPLHTKNNPPLYYYFSLFLLFLEKPYCYLFLLLLLIFSSFHTFFPISLLVVKKKKQKSKKIWKMSLTNLYGVRCGLLHKL